MERFGSLPPVADFVNTTGSGITATVRQDGSSRLVTVGRETLLSDPAGAAIDPSLREATDAAEAAGRTAVFVTWAGAVRGVVTVGDSVRTTSAFAISRLRELGLRPMLLTGDNVRAATHIAGQVGIDTADVIAGVLPEGKVSAVRDLQRSGRMVAMVGDGVNDAAALAQADLGIAIGTGADVAIEAADLTLVRADLASAVTAIHLSRRTLRTIKANLFWAFVYNIALIPIAAFGLLSPLFAGLAMACSSLFVVSNSLRLRRFQPEQITAEPSNLSSVRPR
jgi:Cu+-exporting ATPase